jgi:hypothetical protein
VGEIELQEIVLVIRRIAVHYKLRAARNMLATIERIHTLHTERSPVSHSIRAAIEVRTSFEVLDPKWDKQSRPVAL